MFTKRILSLVLALMMLTSTAFAWGEKTNEDAYKEAIDLLQANKYTEAAEAFFTLGNYSDAPQLAMYCSAVASGESGLYSVAVTNFQSLGAFRDAPLLALYYAGRAYEAAEEYESAQEIYAGMTLYRDVATRLATYPEKILARDYTKADAAEQANLLETALAGFQALGSYKDSEARVTTVQEKINARDYAAADAAETNGDLDTALKGFTALGSYRDSAERAVTVQNKINDRKAAEEEAARAAAYAAADEAEKNEDFATAYDGFLALGDYLDSADRAMTVKQRGQYAKGILAIADGLYSDAYTIFTELGDYQDSQEKAYALGITTFSTLQKITPNIASFTFHNKIGLVNFNDNITIAPQWNRLGKFHNGIAVAKKGDFYGIINLKGEAITGYKYYSITGFVDGIAIACKKDSNGWLSTYKYFLINEDGQAIGTDTWDYLAGNSDGYGGERPVFHNDLIMIGTFNSDTYKYYYGFIDRNGTRIVEPMYTQAYDYSNGLAAVMTSDGNWGFLDASGNIAIPFQYSEVTSFDENGLADVCLNGEWQIINKEGELIYFKKPDVAENEAAENEAAGTVAGNDSDSAIISTFTATGAGFSSNVTVTLELDQHNTIISIVVDSSEELIGFGSRCGEDKAFLAQFIGKTIPLSTGDVDVLSGATVTSTAIINIINSLAE